MSLYQTNTRDILHRIQSLFSAEQYRQALKEVERSKEALLAGAVPGRRRRDLLLLIANVYCSNRKYREARWYIGELEKQYAGIHEVRGFTVLKLKLLLNEGHTFPARRLIEEWRSREPPGDDSPFIDYFTGVLHVRTRDYIEANRHLLRCFRQAAGPTDPVILGNALYMLGIVAFRRALYDTAERYFRAAIEQFERNNRIAMLGIAYRVSSTAAIRRGRYDDAWKWLSRAMAHYKECLDQKGVIDVQLGRALVFIRRDEPDEAERLLRGVMRAARKTGYSKGTARAGVLLGEALCMGERPSEALPYIGEAEKYASLASSYHTEAADILRVRGLALIALGRIDQAEQAIERSLENARHAADRRAIGAALHALGSCALKTGKIDRARALLDESIINLNEAGDSFELMTALLDAAGAYITWGHDRAISEQYRSELLHIAKDYVSRAVRLCPRHGVKRIEQCDSLVRHVESAAGRLKQDSRYRTIRIDPTALHHGMLVARSQHMRDVVTKVRNLAPSTVPILVVGETGTGKEVVARLIHRLSNRSKGPFIAVNCAAVPDSVFESELFGHKRGSFTGAIRDKVGLIEQASGGSIFLDEISELTSQQQAKLLRALQDGMVRRVGETVERPIDVRVISASNEDVDVLRRSGRLRDDFYYRISVETIHLKPLRDRMDDIAVIFEYYLEKFGGECRMEERVFDLLKRHHWPGNVRELVGVARVLALIGKRSGIIHAHDLPLRIVVGSQRSEDAAGRDRRRKITVKKRLSAAECINNPERVREIILLSLAKYHGNKSAAARALGVSRCTLYRRMKDLGMEEA